MGRTHSGLGGGGQSREEARIEGAHGNAPERATGQAPRPVMRMRRGEEQEVEFEVRKTEFERLAELRLTPIRSKDTMATVVSGVRNTRARASSGSRAWLVLRS